MEIEDLSFNFKNKIKLQKTEKGYTIDYVYTSTGFSNNDKAYHKDFGDFQDVKVQILKKMMQHQPFGWLKCEDDDTIFQIIEISPKGITISEEGFIETHEDLNYFSTCCFLDGTKFL